MAILILVLTVLFAVSPFLVPDFGGFDADQFPIPQNDPPVQPAGYAFSIWGLIYLWLLISAVFGLRRGAAWAAMRPALAVSLAVGAIWLAVAVRSPVWASILIWVMLAGALVALARAPSTDKPWAAWPVALFAGWLSAASSVSLGLLAAGYGWMDQTTAAVICVILAIVLAATIQTALKAPLTYAIAVIWALVAVVVQNLGTTDTVAFIAIGGIAGLAVLTWRSLRNSA